MLTIFLELLKNLDNDFDSISLLLIILLSFENKGDLNPVFDIDYDFLEFGEISTFMTLLSL